MKTNPHVGRTVALTNLPAYTDDGEHTSISGLWHIDEFLAAEPAAFIWSDIYYLSREERGVDRSVSVDAYVLLEQIDPSAYAKILAQENQMTTMEEEAIEAEMNAWDEMDV